MNIDWTKAPQEAQWYQHATGDFLAAWFTKVDGKYYACLEGTDDWFEINGYNSDEQYDLTEEGHKGDTWQHFYVKHNEGDFYAEVSVLVSYSHGWQEGEVHRQGLTRKVEQVVTEKVSYV